EIRVRRHALEVLRGALLGVIRLDDLFGHVPAGADALDSSAPIGILENLSHAVTDACLVPVNVVCAVLDGIADGRDLNAGRGDQAQHFPRSLSAASDVGEGNLIAGSYI